MRRVGTYGPPVRALQLAGNREHGVTQGLGVQPAQREVTEQPVVRIELSGLLRSRGCLAVGGGVEDQPVQLLDRPTLVDELERQIVEQLGMAGPSSGHAEVVRRGHQPLAEVVLPDAVDEHARKERVRRRRDPAGEGSASPGSIRSARDGVGIPRRRECGQGSWLDFLARLVVQAAEQEAMHRRLRCHLDGHGQLLQRRRSFLFAGSDRLAH